MFNFFLEDLNLKRINKENRTQEKSQDENKKVVFSDQIKHIYDVAEIRRDLNNDSVISKEKEVLSSNFSTRGLYEKPVIESNFVSIGRNLLMKNQNLNETNKILKDKMKNITGHLDFDMNEYIQKRPEGLENTKNLLTNFDKLSKGEQPKLIPLQSFTSSHLKELMVPVVKAVQNSVGKMKKLDEEINKKEKEKDNTLENILNKQNEIISFMMVQSEEKKEKKIKLKYKEIQQELDKVELGLSPDFNKFNFLNQELNYMLNKETERESFKFNSFIFFYLIFFSNKNI